jgi:putative component of membrane protein insertase Oxa1/YidC/SpoIIIJ protein YidD
MRTAEDLSSAVSFGSILSPCACPKIRLETDCSSWAAQVLLEHGKSSAIVAEHVGEFD